MAYTPGYAWDKARGNDMTFPDPFVVLIACLFVAYILMGVKAPEVKSDGLPRTEKGWRQEVKTEEEQLREKIVSMTSSMRKDREESKRQREESKQEFDALLDQLRKERKESKQRFDSLLTQIKKEWEELPPP